MPRKTRRQLVRHILAVSESFVSLTELSLAHGFTLVEFLAEPACWWPNGLGGYVKPDAYALLAVGTVRDHWWLELDLATESLPAVSKQFLAYLDFTRRGQLGPGQIMPRVIVGTTQPQRLQAISSLVGRLPPPAAQLFHIVQTNELASFLYQVLYE